MARFVAERILEHREAAVRDLLRFWNRVAITLPLSAILAKLIIDLNPNVRSFA